MHFFIFLFFFYLDALVRTIGMVRNIATGPAARPGLDEAWQSLADLASYDPHYTSGLNFVRNGEPPTRDVVLSKSRKRDNAVHPESQRPRSSRNYLKKQTIRSKAVDCGFKV